jgi:glucan phosphoethanolaminetransferase (alkaline phosphatase superfamily)
LAAKFVDFGPAASGGVCSNTSNAILRFAAARRDLGPRMNQTPTLWSYAKKAGYRTVFIDAQARNVGGGGLQNFMTLAETRDIDQVYRLDGDPVDADEALRQIVVKETRGEARVFIYANKEGGHFPYDINYPAQSAKHHPTQTEAGVHTIATNENSYRNAIEWNVNRFMDRLFKDADMTNMALVYTSDHGQQLDPRRLTHCVSTDADARMALVPLLTYTSDPSLTQALKAGAWMSRGKANHFQIAPSLLAFMGYGARDIESHYGESLTQPPAMRPQFTTGDIMGLFSDRVVWNDIDLDASYLESPEAVAAVQ